MFVSTNLFNHRSEQDTGSHHTVQILASCCRVKEVRPSARCRHVPSSGRQLHQQCSTLRCMSPLSPLSASLTLAITRAEDMCSDMFTLFTSSHQPYIRHQIHEETIRLSTILILCTWPPQSGLKYSERNASDVE